MNTFRPLHDNVLVLPDRKPEKTPGGIFIPDNAQKVATEGTVVAVGRGCRTSTGVFIETQVKAGDRILWSSHYDATPIMIDGVEHFVMSESNVIGVAEASSAT